jgi:hypothetical protein
MTDAVVQISTAVKKRACEIRLLNLVVLMKMNQNEWWINSLKQKLSCYADNPEKKPILWRQNLKVHHSV